MAEDRSDVSILRRGPYGVGTYPWGKTKSQIKENVKNKPLTLNNCKEALYLSEDYAAEYRSARREWVSILSTFFFVILIVAGYLVFNFSWAVVPPSSTPATLDDNYVRNPEDANQIMYWAGIILMAIGAFGVIMYRIIIFFIFLKRWFDNPYWKFIQRCQHDSHIAQEFRIYMREYQQRERAIDMGKFGR